MDQNDSGNRAFSYANTATAMAKSLELQVPAESLTMSTKLYIYMRSLTRRERLLRRYQHRQNDYINFDETTHNKLVFLDNDNENDNDNEANRDGSKNNVLECDGIYFEQDQEQIQDEQHRTIYQQIITKSENEISTMTSGKTRSTTMPKLFICDHVSCSIIFSHENVDAMKMSTMDDDATDPSKTDAPVSAPTNVSSFQQYVQYQLIEDIFLEMSKQKHQYYIVQISIIEIIQLHLIEQSHRLTSLQSHKVTKIRDLIFEPNSIHLNDIKRSEIDLEDEASTYPTNAASRVSCIGAQDIIHQIQCAQYKRYKGHKNNDTCSAHVKEDSAATANASSQSTCDRDKMVKSSSSTMIIQIHVTDYDVEPLTTPNKRSHQTINSTQMTKHRVLQLIDVCKFTRNDSPNPSVSIATEVSPNMNANDTDAQNEQQPQNQHDTDRNDCNHIIPALLFGCDHHTTTCQSVVMIVPPYRTLNRNEQYATNATTGTNNIVSDGHYIQKVIALLEKKRKRKSATTDQREQEQQLQPLLSMELTKDVTEKEQQQVCLPLNNSEGLSQLSVNDPHTMNEQQQQQLRSDFILLQQDYNKMQQSYYQLQQQYTGLQQKHNTLSNVQHMKYGYDNKILSFRENEAILYVRQLRKYYYRLLQQFTLYCSNNSSTNTANNHGNSCNAANAGVYALLNEFVQQQQQQLLDIDQFMYDSGIISDNEIGKDITTRIETAGEHDGAPSTNSVQRRFRDQLLAKSQEQVDHVLELQQQQQEQPELQQQQQQQDFTEQQFITGINSRENSASMTQQSDLRENNELPPLNNSLQDASISMQQMELRHRYDYSTPAGKYINLHHEQMMAEELAQLREKNHHLQQALLKETSHVSALLETVTCKKDLDRVYEAMRYQQEKQRYEKKLLCKNNDIQLLITKMNEIYMVSQMYRQQCIDQRKHIQDMEELVTNYQQQVEKLTMEYDHEQLNLANKYRSVQEQLSTIIRPIWQYDSNTDPTGFCDTKSSTNLISHNDIIQQHQLLLQQRNRLIVPFFSTTASKDSDQYSELEELVGENWNDQNWIEKMIAAVNERLGARETPPQKEIKDIGTQTDLNDEDMELAFNRSQRITENNFNHLLFMNESWSDVYPQLTAKVDNIINDSSDTNIDHPMKCDTMKQNELLRSSTLSIESNPWEVSSQLQKLSDSDKGESINPEKQEDLTRELQQFQTIVVDCVVDHTKSTHTNSTHTNSLVDDRCLPVTPIAFTDSYPVQNSFGHALKPAVTTHTATQPERRTALIDGAIASPVTFEAISSEQKLQEASKISSSFLETPATSALVDSNSLDYVITDRTLSPVPKLFGQEHRNQRAIRSPPRTTAHSRMNHQINSNNIDCENYEATASARFDTESMFKLRHQTKFVSEVLVASSCNIGSTSEIFNDRIEIPKMATNMDCCQNLLVTAATDVNPDQVKCGNGQETTLNDTEATTDSQVISDDKAETSTSTTNTSERKEYLECSKRLALNKSTSDSINQVRRSPGPKKLSNFLDRLQKQTLRKLEENDEKSSTPEYFKMFNKIGSKNKNEIVVETSGLAPARDATRTSFEQLRLQSAGRNKSELIGSSSTRVWTAKTSKDDDSESSDDSFAKEFMRGAQMTKPPTRSQHHISADNSKCEADNNSDRSSSSDSDDSFARSFMKGAHLPKSSPSVIIGTAANHNSIDYSSDADNDSGSPIDESLYANNTGLIGLSCSSGPSSKIEINDEAALVEDKDEDNNDKSDSDSDSDSSDDIGASKSYKAQTVICKTNIEVTRIDSNDDSKTDLPPTCQESNGDNVDGAEKSPTSTSFTIRQETYDSDDDQTQINTLSSETVQLLQPQLKSLVTRKDDSDDSESDDSDDSDGKLSNAKSRKEAALTTETSSSAGTNTWKKRNQLSATKSSTSGSDDSDSDDSGPKTTAEPVAVQERLRLKPDESEYDPSKFKSTNKKLGDSNSDDSDSSEDDNGKTDRPNFKVNLDAKQNRDDVAIQSQHTVHSVKPKAILVSSHPYPKKKKESSDSDSSSSASSASNAISKPSPRKKKAFPDSDSSSSDSSRPKTKLMVRPISRKVKASSDSDSSTSASSTSGAKSRSLNDAKHTNEVIDVSNISESVLFATATQVSPKKEVPNYTSQIVSGGGISESHCSNSAITSPTNTFEKKAKYIVQDGRLVKCDNDEKELNIKKSSSTSRSSSAKNKKVTSSDATKGVNSVKSKTKSTAITKKQETSQAVPTSTTKPTFTIVNGKLVKQPELPVGQQGGDETSLSCQSHHTSKDKSKKKDKEKVSKR